MSRRRERGRDGGALRAPRLLVLIALVACGGEEPAPGTDGREGGVPTLALGVVDTSGGSLRVDAEPLFRSALPGAPAFGLVIDGVLLEDGGAAVVDLPADRVVVLSPTGAVDRVLGADGALRQPIGVDRSGPDTLVVTERGNDRVTLFHGDAVIRTLPLSSWWQPVGVQGGGLVVRTGRYHPDFPGPWLPGAIARLDLATGRLDSLAAFEMVPDRRGRPHFAPAGEVAVTPGAIWVGRSDRPRIVRLDRRGRPADVIEWEATAPLVDAEDWARYEAYVLGDPLATVEPEERRAFLAGFEPALGEPLPHFGRIFGDETGNAWLAAYSTDPRIVPRLGVLGADGRWLGSVELPPGRQVLDVAFGRILAVEPDAGGRATVAVYRVDPGPSSAGDSGNRPTGAGSQPVP